MQQQIGRWSFDVQGMCMFGANSGQADKSQSMGTGWLTPGVLNRPLYARPTYYAESDSELSFSPVAEVRAAIRLRMTNWLYLRANGSSVYMSDFLSATTNLTGKLPQATLDAAHESMLVHNLFVGLEYVQ